MSAVIFVGPTLPAHEVAGALKDVICRPPVAQGDVYRATRLRPRAIGIIDGYFSGAPAVWHKEILWALSQGIRVYGSASMGALRAAELHAFGMVGVGHIFEAYRDGHLEDDDEVAVLHGPAELGYPALSEAMVSVRATIERAAQEGIVSLATQRALVRLAKAEFFGRRTWPCLLALARQHGLPAVEIDALEVSLDAMQVDLKRSDALAMLRVMAGPEPAAPVQPSFHFERTHFWDELVRREAPSAAAAEAVAPSAALVADELRLKGLVAYAAVEARAVARVLASLEEPPALAVHVSGVEVRDELGELRQARGLWTQRELTAWLEANRLTETTLERLVQEDARLRALRRRYQAEVEAAIADELRLSGEYEALAERALLKLTSAASHAVTDRLPAPPELRVWFFSHRLGVPMPHTLLDVVERLGFASSADFDACLLHEWRHVHNETG